MKTLAYDLAADDEKVHAALDRAGIKPVIHNRTLWKDGESERRPDHCRWPLNLVHDEAGTMYCPARHEGWTCPCATKQFERLYKGRTAVERVNGRLKIFWGIDDGNVVGARRFHAWVGAIQVVHLGLATLLAKAPRHDGTLGKMNLSPIAKLHAPARA